MRAALRQVEGAYALVVMHRGEISRLVGARQNVPLVVGLNGEESFIASDVAAILAHTNRVVFLEEGDVADVRPTGVVITDVDGVVRERAVTIIDWTPEAAEKGGYDHFMLKEIHEQPTALRQSLAGRVTADGRIHAPEVDGLEDVLRRVTRVEIVACGTASYAALVGAAAIQDWTGLPARVTVGSEFRYAPPPLDADTLVIAVTQSGETADTIAPTRWARERGCPIVAVTNTVGSAITREADAVMFLQAGPEIAVAASQDVRDPGHDARRPRRGDRQGPRTLGRGAGAGAGPRAAGAPRRRGARAGAQPGHRGPRPPLRQLARLHVRRPRLLATRRRSRARSSSRRSATSTPRATRPAS